MRRLADPKLTATQKARVVDILAGNDDPSAGKTLLQLLIGDAAPEVKARAAENLRLFLPTKWNSLADSGELKAAIYKLLKDGATVGLGLQLVAAANHVPAIDTLGEWIGDAKLPEAVRVEAVRTLGQLPHAKAVELLDAIIVFGKPTAVQMEAIRAMGSQIAGKGDSSLAKKAQASLQTLIEGKGVGPELKQAALVGLAGSRAGSSYLLDRKEHNQLSAELIADAGRLLRNSPFQAERNRALALFPAPSKLDLKKLPGPAVLAKKVGNADNGERVMARSLTSEVQCLKCHMVRGTGGQIGPDLSMIGKKGSKENLFESILIPSKAIADQHVSWKIDTVDGQTITGLIVGETETTVTLRDANGKDYPIAVKDIDKRGKSLVSLMPDNLVAALNEDELIDLVEYLATLQTPSLTPDAWYVAGPFPTDGGDKEFGPEKGPFDAKQKFPANGKGEIGWRTVRLSAGRYVDLAAFHGPAANNTASYLYQTIESPADQEATILLGTDDGGKLWVNGELAFKTDATRAATPDQETVKVKLKKGANAVLLKVTNGNKLARGVLHRREWTGSEAGQVRHERSLWFGHGAPSVATFRVDRRRTSG